MKKVLLFAIALMVSIAFVSTGFAQEKPKAAPEKAAPAPEKAAPAPEKPAAAPEKPKPTNRRFVGTSSRQNPVC